MTKHKRPSFEEMIKWVDSRLRHVEEELDKEETDEEEEELVDG
jgi:hypothetical protein